MKQILLKSIVYLIFLALFNGLFFGFVDYYKCPDAVWVAFIGINVSYISLLLIPALAPKSNGRKVLSGSLYLIGSFFFIAELIAGLCFLFWPTATITWPVCIMSSVYAIYLIVLLSSVAANDATIKSTEQQHYQNDIRNFRCGEIKDVLDSISDRECKKVVNTCYYEMQNSPLKSAPDVQAIEQEIDQLIGLLKGYALSNDTEQIKTTAGKIRTALNRRNNKLKHLTQY